jgi:hypothetical protein
MRIAYGAAATCLTVLTACVVPASARAQAKFAQPAIAQGQPQQISVPDAEKLVLLVRLSLLTLNDAVLSGNYAVLRERGGPSFRQANTAASLARVFTALEHQVPDLSAVATATPRLTEARVVGPEQHLAIRGHFPLKPLEIHFDLVFEPADGRWQLFGLSVAALPSSAPEVADAPPASPPPPKKRQSGRAAKDK